MSKKAIKQKQDRVIRANKIIKAKEIESVLN